MLKNGLQQNQFTIMLELSSVWQYRLKSLDSANVTTLTVNLEKRRLARGSHDLSDQEHGANNSTEQGQPGLL